jgi:hypothetical protein
LQPSKAEEVEVPTLDVEAIDLATLTVQLAQRVEAGARVGPIAGRTAFRDEVVALLHCSALEAEQVVDTLVARSFLVFRAGAWQLQECSADSGAESSPRY